MLPKPLVFFGLFISLAACSPLVPISYVEGGKGGQLTQSIETDEATVWLKYMESQNGYMVFDLEVENHSSSPMPVAPQQISFYASSKTFIPIQNGDNVHKLSGPNSTLTMVRQFACDPTSVQRVYAEKARSKKVEAGIITFLAIGVMVFDASKDSKSFHKEMFTSKGASKSFGRDVMVTTALIAKDIAQSSAQKKAEDSYYIPFELFPECTIKSGRNVRGKIFLPIESRHKYIRVIVPLPNADYVFDFKRSGVKPAQPLPMMGASNPD